MSDTFHSMTCPECALERTGSRVELVSHMTERMAVVRYAHADALHVHDPNRHGYTYRCSRGHEWSVDSREPCPTCGWAWRPRLAPVT